MAAAAASCNDDKSTLVVSALQVTLDAAGNPQSLLVQTNEPIWEVISEDTWPIIQQDSFSVTITAASNPSREPRVARFYIAAGSRFERVILTQEGSLHVFGDLYPDAINPVGVIYKVMDGGQHGLVVSLDQLSATPWGPITDTHETDFVNGRQNTRNIIAAHAADANFATDYPAFAWVYAKNGNNLDGAWFIPSFWETYEMYNFLVGNFAYIIPGGTPPSMQLNLSRPTQNITLRDAFDASVVAAGGTPFSYSGSAYWSSSEASVTSAAAISFHNGSDPFHSAINYNKATTGDQFFRAVYEF
jgi:hypothetical protein